MSSPSPGRQEAGAPCTGESLILIFSMQTLHFLELRGSDVSHAEELNKADHEKFGQQ